MDSAHEFFPGYPASFPGYPSFFLDTPYSSLDTPHSSLETPHSSLDTPHSSLDGLMELGVAGLKNTVIMHNDVFQKLAF